jgi:alpha-beta hydrolase superfamily lysophospholipase
MKLLRFACLMMGSLGIAACTVAPPGGAPQPLPAGTPTEGAVRLETPTGAVHGALLLPARRGPMPVALLVAGSGPTDRDGNNTLLPGQNNSLKLLAEQLAAQGIASVRYDKRGVAASASATLQEADLRFDTYVDDAAAWVRKLRQDPRFSAVAVIGHSEGSLIGMRAAHNAAADAFVSIAGIARTAPQVLRDQLRPQLPAPLWEQSERILRALEAGRTADSVPPALGVLYRPSVQPYLISWFRYDPAREIARLQMPVLIVQGTTDVQVPVAEARALHAASPAAEFAVIEGMNHVLKAVPADPARQQASYSDPTLPVVPELIDRIVLFIRSAAPQKTSSG